MRFVSFHISKNNNQLFRNTLRMRYDTFFQFWSAYVPCGAAQLNAVQLSLEQIDVIRRLAEMNAQHLTLVTSVKGE